jgi:predicted dehydrogenase
MAAGSPAVPDPCGRHGRQADRYIHGMKPIRLVTVAPGHFHAALVQKHATPGVDSHAHVYAPLDADLVAHLGRVAAFNTRADNPTAWELDVRAGGDWRERFRRERSGNVAVLSGRNRPKVGLIRDAVAAGYHVLADKPWVVDAADLPELDAALSEAQRCGLLVWDVMTERHEVTNRLLRAITRDRDVFGDWLPGSPENPGLALASTHYLRKTVDGRPLLRPWWWFDPNIAGEGMADVGTHLADLALWLVAPDRPVEAGREAEVHGADRWPLALTREQFAAVTGLADVPAELAPQLAEGAVRYRGNHTARLTVRGVHVRLTTLWDYDSPGGDTHTMVGRGTRATVIVRQEPGRPPELFVQAAGSPADLRAACGRWQAEFPGLAVTDHGPEVQLVIPPQLRTGHEDHFAAVLADFVRAFHDPAAVPEWERVNARTKYHLTTRAVELAQERRPF